MSCFVCFVLILLFVGLNLYIKFGRRYENEEGREKKISGRLFFFLFNLPIENKEDGERKLKKGKASNNFHGFFSSFFHFRAIYIYQRRKLEINQK